MTGGHQSITPLAWSATAPAGPRGADGDRPGQDLLDLLSELLAVERDGRRLYADNLRDAPDHMQPKRLDTQRRAALAVLTNRERVEWALRCMRRVLRRPGRAIEAPGAEIVLEVDALVVDRQRDRGGALVDTLGRYLECGGGYDATAAAFNVHRSTVQYRLNRIAEVSGHNLTDPDTTFTLQLATRARETWRR